MSRWQRIRSFLIGVTMMLLCVLLIYDHEDAYSVVVIILSISMIAKGLGSFLYFVTMAQHMVGGKLILFEAIIFLDLGAFTLTLSDVPHIYVSMYLLGVHGLSGVGQLLRGMENKRLSAPGWRLSFAHGAVNVIIALSSLIFLNVGDMLVYLYCTGLFYSAVIRIITAFRKTAMVYTQ